ncbi:MAG: extracellular solute-binding protein [Deltaproteobacteria bacterium]|nr:extracellular solute-binding protein [Deltaproteobacteria bacterium]
MGKKGLLIFLALVFVFGLLAGPGLAADDLKRFKGQKITVTCWSGPYTNDFKKAYVEPFMKASGAIVIVSPGWAEFMSKIKASPEDKPPYDVFMADGWNYIAAMNIHRLLPIRKENIPNARDIYPELLKREAWVKGYGVPFDGGIYLPIYVPGKVHFTPDSWKDLMREEVSGKLSLDQTFYYGLYASAFISDKKPGVQELYSKEGMDEVFRISAELATHVKKFYKGGAELFQLIKTGEVVMGTYYSGGTFSEMNKGTNVRMVFPKEGAVAWIGYLTVMKGTKNRDLAEAFINWCIAPENQTHFAQINGGWVSNTKAKIAPALKGVVPSSNEEFKKTFFFDWDLLNKQWGELEERWKKEVLSKAQ